MGRSTAPMRALELDWARRDAAERPHPAPIGSMSLQPGIPWRVALQQSPPPLPRLLPECTYTVANASLLQRTATRPLFPGLTNRAHSSIMSAKGRPRLVEKNSSENLKPHLLFGTYLTGTTCARDRDHIRRRRSFRVRQNNLSLRRRRNSPSRSISLDRPGPICQLQPW